MVWQSTDTGMGSHYTRNNCMEDFMCTDAVAGLMCVQELCKKKGCIPHIYRPAMLNQVLILELVFAHIYQPRIFAFLVGVRREVEDHGVQLKHSAAVAQLGTSSTFLCAACRQSTFINNDVSCFNRKPPFVSHELQRTCQIRLLAFHCFAMNGKPL